MPPSVEAGHKRPMRTRILLVCLAGIAGIPLLLASGVNIWLATSSGRKWVARKIDGTSGMRTDVGWSSATPWSGVAIHKFSLTQPAIQGTKGISAPLLEVERIRLAPVWKAWLRGRLEVSSIELDSPHIVLPLEMLAHMGAVPAPPLTPPTQANPSAPPHSATSPPGAINPAPPQPPAKTPAPAAPTSPTGWIRLHDASFSLVTTEHADKPLIRISGVGGDIPIAGAAAQSVLTIEEVSCLGKYTIKPPQIPLRWQNAELTFSESQWNICGWKMAFAAKCSPRPGLPFMMEILLPKQDGVLRVPSIQREAKITAGNAIGRIAGYVAAPSTWQGDLAVGTGRFSLPFQNNLTFDQTGILLSLRSGMAVCRDARALGESASLLGNAALLADGRCAAVLRVVLPADAAGNLMTRAKEAANGTRWSFAPMGTTDRLFSDISALGTWDQISVTFGNDGSTLPLPKVVSLFQQLAPRH